MLIQDPLPPRNAFRTFSGYWFHEKGTSFVTEWTSYRCYHVFFFNSCGIFCLKRKKRLFVVSRLLSCPKSPLFPIPPIRLCLSLSCQVEGRGSCTLFSRVLFRNKSRRSCVEWVLPWREKRTADGMTRGRYNFLTPKSYQYYTPRIPKYMLSMPFRSRVKSFFSPFCFVKATGAWYIYNIKWKHAPLRVKSK